jgi:SAM-dependent methyltransferase
MRVARWPRSEQEWLNFFVPNEDYQQNVYAAELNRAVTPGTKWLDLGAGRRVHGGWQLPAGTVASSRELGSRAGFFVGADFELEHLRANPHLHARLAADGARLPFRDAAFDLVSANMVVEHLARPVDTFSEVARVLKPGGRFLFVTPNRGYPIVWLSAVLASPRARKALASRIESRALEHVFETHYSCNTRAAIRATAGAAGFRVDLLRVFNSFPFLRRPLPLLVAEGLWIRMTALKALADFRSNLVVSLERKADQAC